MHFRQFAAGTATALVVAVIGSGGIFGHRLYQEHLQKIEAARSAKPVAATKVARQSSSEKQVAHLRQTSQADSLSNQHVQYHWTQLNGRKVIDWNQPTGDHPSLQGIATNELRIVVDQASPQRMRIYQGDRLLTQFIVSTGKATNEDNHTPDGNWTIQPEHGDWFYNPKKGIESGAHNWISWKDHGVYLFHSVTYHEDGKTLRMDRQGNLGKPNSDGCVQMSIPDSQWFYQNFKDRTGTRIEIIHGDQVQPDQN